MAQQHFTGKRSAELKSTFPRTADFGIRQSSNTNSKFNSNQFNRKTNINQFNGNKAEQAVVRLFQQRSWVLEFERAKTKIAEIDLVFSHGRNVVLVEVKRLDSTWRSFERIHPKQVELLRKNRVHLTHCLPQFAFQSYLAWVTPRNEVSFVLID